MFAKVGEWFLNVLATLGHGLLFSMGAILDFLKGKHRLSKLSRAIWQLGIRCIPVVLLIGLFTGLVIGLLGADSLGRFGASSLLGPAVGLSLVRELAPVLTGLVVVGQAGSSLCSELGIYRQDDHVNALKMMNLSPRGYLAGAPLLASLVTYPILTAFFCLTGLFGGYLSGVKIRLVDSGVYWQGVFDGVALSDVRMGLVKGLVFGLLTTSLCAYCGFFSDRLTHERGARAVSLLTTRAVIFSSISILVADYLITALTLSD